MNIKYKILSPFLLLLFVTVILLLSSCKKYLDETVYSNISSTNFWLNNKDALAGLDATYTLSYEFGAHNRMFFILTDMVTDDMDDEYSNTEVERRQLNTYSFSSLNSYINTAWVALYKTIAQANIVIAKVPSIPGMSDADKNTIVGEAKFLRAMEYFYLTQLWGQVPIDTIAVNTINQTLIPKSSVADVYKVIISDLQFAETNCADNPPQTGRTSKWAAKSLLGKVYLTEAGPFTSRDAGMLNLAESKLAEVINSNRFSLVSNIIDYFNIKKKGSSEAIYEDWQIGDVSSSLGSFMHRNAMPSSISDPSITTMTTAGYKAWSPTPDLWSKYLPQDDRLKMYYFYYIKKNSDGTYKIQQDNVPYIAKYVDSSTIARDAKANNLPRLRYSDILLMYAEVLNELGTVNAGDAGHNQYYYLNLVRKRAFSSNPTPYQYKDMAFTQAQFRDSLMLERRLELAHEGQRLFDMKRTGTFISGMTAYAAKYASLQSSPPTYKASYPAGVFPNPAGAKPYAAGTITFTSDFIKNAKITGPQPFQVLYPIPGAQIQVFNIGQNQGY